MFKSIKFKIVTVRDLFPGPLLPVALERLQQPSTATATVLAGAIKTVKQLSQEII
jgi:hypothetical protein